MKTVRDMERLLNKVDQFFKEERDQFAKQQAADYRKLNQLRREIRADLDYHFNRKPKEQ